MPGALRSYAVLGGALAFAAAAASPHVSAAETESAVPIVEAPPATFLKGNTHLHSRGSGDASASLSDIEQWYSAAGYDFVVVTDHNVVTDVSSARDLLVIPGVELTRNPGSCDPAPPLPDGKCRMHVNGLFVDPTRELGWERGHSASREAIYARQIAAISDLGGVAQLNHPTWHHGVSGSLLAALARRGMAFVEIANDGFATWNRGDGDYPSTEEIWDEALTAGATVWGIASDDAHHIEPHRGDYPPGGGFVMVRAERTTSAIRAAMLRGDFYSSTGVLLDELDVDDDRIAIAIAAASPGVHTIEWIGDGGTTLRIDRGRFGRYDFDDAPPGTTYVRATITDSAGNTAWLQPVRIGGL